MRGYLVMTACLVACVAGFGQDTQQQAPADPQLYVSNYGKRFVYFLPHPEQVRAAWIEIVDRPLLLDKKAVTIQANGAIDWEWDRSTLNDYEQPEDNLWLSIWDPNGETVTCDVNTVMSSQPGGIVTGATVGARQELTPMPVLYGTWMRAAQGSPSLTVNAMGRDLGPSAKFQVDASRGGRCGPENLHVHVLNLGHATITLDGDCLQKAGILRITTENDTGYGVNVHVASRTSPVLQSVSPSTLPDDLPQNDLKLVLRGDGFTKDSKVFAGYDPDANDFQRVQMWLETEYVSPTKLRAHVDGTQPQQDTVAQPEGENLRLWVTGNEEKFELSRPFDVKLRPTGKPLPDGRLSEADFRRWKPKTAEIISVSPFPIRLMDEHSPEEQEVTIRGESFSPQDKVHFSFGNNANNDKEVRTQYVSPTMMQAWLPRQFWRKHAVYYRLVVVTTDGKRYIREVEQAYGESL